MHHEGEGQQGRNELPLSTIKFISLLKKSLDKKGLPWQNSEKQKP